MAWCEENGVDYIFGLAGNPVLHRLAYEVADDLKVRRAEAGRDRIRAFAAFAYAARSWRCERRVVARLEDLSCAQTRTSITVVPIQHIPVLITGVWRG